MALVIIDGRELVLPEGRRLNGIEAARLVGIEIPHYCWHPGLSVVGSCRMCLVEVGTHDPKTGQITMQPKLVPACNTPAVDGTVFVTNSEKVRQARARVEEGLLLRHPIDCPICDKAGECLLQDYYFLHGQPERRADLRPYTSRRRDIGDVTLFVDRCILCSRCVRFTREISGSSELMVVGRGTQEEIDVFPGRPLHNNLSGNVVDLCPVGALADKDFLYRQRVWFMRSHRAVCTRCAVGCSVWIDENQDRIYRVRPRANPFVNKWWICNEGRYGYHYVHDRRRLLCPMRRDGQSLRELDWSRLPDELLERLRTATPLAAIISPFLSVEEAYLLCKLMRSVDPQAILACGPIPVVGQDEYFPGGFVVLAEKCPNRRGVEAVLAHFVGKVTTFDQLLEQLADGLVRGVWVAGGYPMPWIDQQQAERFERLELLVVQDLFPSPLSDRASYILPAAAFAEREGSYVNRNDWLQTSAWAIRPPSGVRPEGQLCWQMLGLPGLYNARTVLDEIARQIGFFSAATCEIPETGLDLRVNLLAEGKTESPQTQV